MAHDRVLLFDGVHNFRDYGGYAVAGGGCVRRGVLWRSGQHRDASAADLARIAALDLRHVIDLRGNGERAQYPCTRPAGFGAEVIFHDGETAGLAPHVEAVAQGGLTAAAAHEAMRRLYADLPQRAALIDVGRRFFAALEQGEGASLVHCLAGKDRTGMLVAMAHHALGVHPDDAMADYLLTNEAGNIEARIAAGAEAVRDRYGAVDDQAVRVLMSVHPAYLDAARTAVESAHGSLDAFLADVLEVDGARRERLRAHLVE